jgi:hypothetical protein
LRSYGAAFPTPAAALENVLDLNTVTFLSIGDLLAATSLAVCK